MKKLWNFPAFRADDGLLLPLPRDGYTIHGLSATLVCIEEAYPGIPYLALRMPGGVDAFIVSSQQKDFTNETSSSVQIAFLQGSGTAGLIKDLSQTPPDYRLLIPLPTGGYFVPPNTSAYFGFPGCSDHVIEVSNVWAIIEMGGGHCGCKSRE